MTRQKTPSGTFFPRGEEGKSVHILDNTLRDGSYALDFCFTPDDTAFLAGLLERAGFSFIEIGHGLGLGAGRHSKWQMPQPDEVYLERARKSVARARLGVFFIPGIGTEDDLRLGRDLGMDFVRIGTNVTEFESAFPFIEAAGKLGYGVASNLMKSYAVPPETFARTARRLQDGGAEIVYIVDSAGGMMPHEVRAYFNHVRQVCDVAMGFHGHNNLNLATANTIEAVDCGARMVDCSLAGLGRSAGNASAESVLAILERKEIATGIDLYFTLDIAERYIKTLVAKPEADSLAVTSGLAKFHSGFIDKVLKYADRYHIEPKRLIVAAAAINPISTDDAVIQAAAEQILARNEETIEFPRNTVLKYQERKGAEHIIQNADDSLKSLLKGMRILSKKTGLKTVIRIGFIVDQILETAISEFGYSDEHFIVGKIQLDIYSLTENLIKDLDGSVDFALLDTFGLSSPQVRAFLEKLKKNMSKTRVVHYNSAVNKQRVLSHMIQNHVTENGARRFLVYGSHEELVRVLMSLDHRLEKIYLVRGDRDLNRKIFRILTEINPDFERIVSLWDDLGEESENGKIDLVLALTEPTPEHAIRLMDLLDENGLIICPPYFQVFNSFKDRESAAKKLAFLDADGRLSSVVIEAMNFVKDSSK